MTKEKTEVHEVGFYVNIPNKTFTLYCQKHMRKLSHSEVGIGSTEAGVGLACSDCYMHHVPTKKLQKALQDLLDSDKEETIIQCTFGESLKVSKIISREKDHELEKLLKDPEYDKWSCPV